LIQIPTSLTVLTNQKHTISHKCLAEFRNTGKVSKVLIKFLHKILHVYIDTQDGVGYKFCLAVEFDRTYKDYHIAFSAATGQVADNHDIVEITTRYLAESDQETDDSSLPHLSDVKQSDFRSFYWAICILVGSILTFFGVYEIIGINQLKQIDAVIVCKKLNAFVVPHYLTHALLTISFLFLGTWTAFILNIPLFLYRLYLFITKQHYINPSLAADQNHSIRLYLTIVLYVVDVLYYLYCFSRQ